MFGQTSDYRDGLPLGRGSGDAGPVPHRRTAMSRVRLVLISLGMAFAVPALTDGYVPLATTLTEEAACTPQPDPEFSDTRWVWRLRAYRHLDCVDAIVDRALAKASTDRIEISRADLERIRAEAWYARDAAARIGQ
jgi:hypothetical protein